MAYQVNRLLEIRLRSPVRGALAAASLVGALLLPPAAAADCIERFSRIPIAAPAAAAGPGFRAAMLRTTRSPPAGAVSRPRAMKAKAVHAARKARPARQASLKRPVRNAGIPRRAAVAPSQVLVPVRRVPTPMPVAARELATPASYALISAIICDGPGLVGPVFPEDEPGPVPPPGVEVFPDLGPEPGIFFPPAPEPGPFLEDWPLLRPQPPSPPSTPGPAGVPEPGVWALMIVGFGLVGVRLRRRPSGLAPGR